MKREWMAFGWGLLLGGAVIGMVLGSVQATALGSTTFRPALKYPLQVKLHRVLIKDGESGHFSDWLRFLDAHHGESVATLAREHMYVEAMFRDPKNEPNVLYWLEVSDAGGAHADTSNYEVDRVHVQYMHQVLDAKSWSVLDTRNLLVAPFVEAAIAGHQ